MSRVARSSAQADAGSYAMIDNFALALSHGLLLLAAWRLIWRKDLDVEAPPKPAARPQGFFRRPPRERTPGA
jgi:hypothetical protein